MPEEGGAVFPLILSNPPPVYDASFGFLLYWKRPSERYFQTAFCLFLRKFCTAAACNNGVFPCAVSACRQTAAFPVACSKLRPNSLCLDAEVLCFPLFEAVRHLGAAFSSRIGLPMRTTTVSDGLIRMPSGCKAFISLSFFYGASRLGTAITATICAVSCYNLPALPIRPSEAHFQTASTKEKTNHEPIPLARYRQSAARPAPAG